MIDFAGAIVTHHSVTVPTAEPGVYLVVLEQAAARRCQRCESAHLVFVARQRGRQVSAMCVGCDVAAHQ